MPYQINEFLQVLFNLSTPLCALWAALVLGSMVHRALGILIAGICTIWLAGSLWYQFIGAEGSARYLISRLDDPNGPPGYNPTGSPWWLPCQNITLSLLILFTLLAIPFAIHFLEGRKSIGSLSTASELRLLIAPTLRVVGRGAYGFFISLGAIITGTLGALVGLIVGFVLGLPIGFILGICFGLEFETTVFHCAYVGGGLGFILGGGWLVALLAGSVTRKTFRRMNETHLGRVEDRQRMAKARRDAITRLNLEHELHRRRMLDT